MDVTRRLPQHKFLHSLRGVTEDATLVRSWHVYVQRSSPLILATVLPILLNRSFWGEVWHGARARAWDGTGHYALAQLYDQTIFPDTFGWTHAYFAGLPFPNFYPPLFYWLVALLHHTHLLSFVSAFKLVVALPVLLLPAAIWVLAWVMSGKNRSVATGAALAIIPLLVDHRLSNPIGLSHASTFLIGLYTQPLGFVLLVAWFVTYLSAHRRLWRFALTSVLLALTVLANFFAAITATLFVVVTVAFDLVGHHRTAGLVSRRAARSKLVAHLTSPLVAACLALFWLVPMISTYDYFVTRPHTAALHELVPPMMVMWYALAAIGILLWLRRPTPFMWPYVATCLALAGGVIFAASVAPPWFALQTPRFLSVLNFLLAVPVGQAVGTAFHRVAAFAFGNSSAHRPQTKARRQQPLASSAFLRAPLVISSTLILLVSLPLLIEPSSTLGWLTFYPTEDRERIDPVLRFAARHRDGRYLVEVPHFSQPEAAHDGRAINSYLGAQGNETLSVVFREASPNALFFNPLINAFSTFPDNYGISSVLADDLDFAERPLASHLERARLMGVKYLVILSLRIKNQLAGESAVGTSHDFDQWSVIELGGAQPPLSARSRTSRPWWSATTRSSSGATTNTTL